MKVNFNGANGKMIRDIPCGETFVDERRSRPGETGVYIKVSADNFVNTVKPLQGYYCYAVNLENGYMKKYESTAVVVPIKTEVNFVKG